jgi:hypothetical protein
MLWDDDQRKFVDGGATTTRLDDPCVQGLTITPQEVIERIRKAKGQGGRLDLAGIGLREVPSEVWTLTDLVDLQLSNNEITALPEAFGHLKRLERLGVAGNRLRALPESIGNCAKLEGLWAHGNLLGSLPATIEKCEWMRNLMLAGNRLRSLPDGIGKLDALEELSVPGNRLEAIPETVEECVSLRVLDLHGNRVRSLPAALGTKCRALEDIQAQGNRLTSLPESLCEARRLKRLNVAENELTSLPEKLGNAVMLNQLWVYSNQNLKSIPESLAANVSLKSIWAEGCALDGEGEGTNALRAYISAASEGGGGKRKTPPAVLGVDSEQLARAGLDKKKIDSSWVKVSDANAVSSWLAGGSRDTPRGYFKLDRWVVPAVLRDPEGVDSEKSPILIVAFGSAPGVPNWGGLLKKLRNDVVSRGEKNVGGAGANAALAVQCARLGFDILYVSDTARSWYGGDGFEGDGDMGERAVRKWRAAILEISESYSRTIHLGDSMGASAALLFSDVSDVSLAFCPQVDLVRASIRPGRSAPWMRRYESNLIAAVGRSIEKGGKISIHTGSWRHDVDQASVVCSRLNPGEGNDTVTFIDQKSGGSVRTIAHHVDTHRLALALEEGGELLPIVRVALLEQVANALQSKGAPDDENPAKKSPRSPSAGVDETSPLLKKFNPAVRVKLE